MLRHSPFTAYLRRTKKDGFEYDLAIISES